MEALIRKLLADNGYVDEFIGSWHRYVDAQEKIADALDRIADSLNNK